MTFLEEVLQSEECPADFEKKYAQFQGYQQAALDTLKVFHRVCEDNGIPYQLAYGSLLGAIREGGQIPWDYDVDVLVAYEDKNRLVEALKKDLDPDYYFYSPDTDSDCRHFMMRLTPKEYRSEMLHVDVFYVIGAPEDKNEQRAFSGNVYNAFKARYYKKVDLADIGLGRWRRIIKVLLYRSVLLFLPMKRLEKWFEELCHAYPIQKAKWCIPIGTETKKRVFSTQKLWDLMPYETNSGTFYITRHYDEILKQIYGNYMQRPSLTSRLQEMLDHLHALNKNGKK